MKAIDRILGPYGPVMATLEAVTVFMVLFTALILWSTNGPQRKVPEAVAMSSRPVCGDTVSRRADSVPYMSDCKPKMR